MRQIKETRQRKAKLQSKEQKKQNIIIKKRRGKKKKRPSTAQPPQHSSAQHYPDARAPRTVSSHDEYQSDPGYPSDLVQQQAYYCAFYCDRHPLETETETY
jgi:hypothetical protein